MKTSKRSGRNRGAALVAGLFTLLGAIWAGTTLMAHHVPSVNSPTIDLQDNTTDGPSVPLDGNVRAAIEHALRTHQGKTVPPVSGKKGLVHQVTGQGDVTVADESAAPTADDLATQKADATADIDSVFGPTAGDKEKKALDTSIAMEHSDNFRVLGGGYQHLKFTSVETTGDTTTVIFSVDAWSKIKFKNPNGTWVTSKPTNTLNATMTLTQNAPSQQWMVQSFDWSFAPGSEP